MAETTTKKNPPINTSGWTDEEITMLDTLVKSDGLDRSKVIRAAVRKSYVERKHVQRAAKRFKHEVESLAS